MREPWLNEIRGLMPHIRVNILTGQQVYRDQVKMPRVEEEHLRRLKGSGQVEQGAGRRVGLDTVTHAHKLARTNFARSPHSASEA